MTAFANTGPSRSIAVPEDEIRGYIKDIREMIESLDFSSLSGNIDDIESSVDDLVEERNVARDEGGLATYALENDGFVFDDGCWRKEFLEDSEREADELTTKG